MNIEIKPSSNASIIAVFSLIIVSMLIGFFLYIESYESKLQLQFEKQANEIYIEAYLKGKEDATNEVLKTQREFNDNLKYNER